MNSDQIVKWLEETAKNGDIQIRYRNTYDYPLENRFRQPYFQVWHETYLGCGETLAEAIEDMD